MVNLRYEFAKLRTDYYLGGIEEYYRTGNPIPPPAYILWDCTRRCNLSCLHCGAVKEEYTHELTTNEIRSILDQLAKFKVGMFAVTGGEPLLRNDLPEVLSHARGRGLKTGIATNGYLINRASAAWIREAHVDSVQVSLDGPEETHNRIRGNNESFARAVQAIEYLTEVHVPQVSVATTVTSGNLREIDALRQLLLRLGVKLWRLAVVMPIGRAQKSNLTLDGDQLTWLLNFVREARSRDLRIYLGENLTFLGEWEKQIRNAPAICPIGYTACCIGVDGNVRGCPEQEDTLENREGNLLETPFQEIWQKGFRRYRTRDILSRDAICSTCGSKNECFGGCWVMRSGGRHCTRTLLSPSSSGAPEKPSPPLQ
jgi:radical SAM protein with 4Fe4S-binding SPASM domain